MKHLKVLTKNIPEKGRRNLKGEIYAYESHQECYPTDSCTYTDMGHCSWGYYGSSQDVCDYDYSGCSNGSLDNCQIDNASCGTRAYDDCKKYAGDYSACVGTGQTDLCDVITCVPSPYGG